MHVTAWHFPLLEKIYRPAIHSHWADWQDHNLFATLLARHGDSRRDLMPHHYVKIRHSLADDGLKIRVPPRLPVGDSFRWQTRQFIDSLQVPAGREELLEQRPIDRRN